MQREISPCKRIIYLTTYTMLCCQHYLMFLNIFFQINFLYSEVKAQPNEMWCVRFVKQIALCAVL